MTQHESSYWERHTRNIVFEECTVIESLSRNPKECARSIQPISLLAIGYLGEHVRRETRSTADVYCNVMLGANKPLNEINGERIEAFCDFSQARSCNGTRSEGVFRIFHESFLVFALRWDV